ncbi:MAG: tetratricopeptide repeat protein [Kiritimatiellae bacterium]|nr:tetratricopeptide repeat protein [Kiritimatiellia bacterium]
MRCKDLFVVASGLLFAFAMLGCQSPAPQVVQQPVAASASPDRLALQLSEVRLEQQRLERELTKLNDDLYRTALAIKQIKDRMEEVTAYTVTNAARMAQIDTQIRETRRRIGDQSSLEANVLRSSLENEQRAQERLRGLLSEREREVRDLRSAMRAQQSALNEKPRSAEPTTPAAVPGPVVSMAPRRDASPVPAIQTPSAGASASAITIRQTNVVTAKKQAPQPVATTSTVSVYRIVAEAQRLSNAGDLERAQKLYEAALRRQPDLTSALLGLATIRYQVDDLVSARKYIDDVLAADSKNARGYGLRGLISWREGFAKDGMRDCARAVELDPTDALLHKFYGITLHARGQTASAVREMRKAIELDPADSEAKLNLAILLASGSRPSLDEARMFYTEALSGGAARDPMLDQTLGIAK